MAIFPPNLKCRHYFYWNPSFPRLFQRRERRKKGIFVCFFRATPRRGSGRQRVKLPKLGCSAESSPACSQWSAARNNLQFSSHLYNYIEIYTENIYKIEVLWEGGNPGAKPTTPRALQPLRWTLSPPSPWGSKKKEGFGLNQQFRLGFNKA